MRLARSAGATMRSVRRTVVPLVVLSLAAAACSADDGGAATSDLPATDAAPPATDTTPAATAPATAAPTTDPPDPETGPPVAPLELDVRPGTEQLAILGAEPGQELAVLDDAGGEVARSVVDDFGSLLFRRLDPAVDYTIVGSAGASGPHRVLGRDDHPDPAFYAEQRLTAPGFGYLTARDGTTLSVNVVLPGPVDEGPYPTVVEYSGYTPSDPDAGGFKDLFPPLGYAYVGVNMRGTGCSGGSFRFFEYAQSTDGYDVIEAVAAQPWVQHGQVGMVGVSYPGISQLYVAQTRPPGLAAITPFSVLDDSYQSTLYPGGLLNTGFAVEWTQQRVDDARPEGQAWAADRIAAGDDECAANQRVRLQNPNLVEEILANPYYDPATADELAPRLFVERIEVPTFLAGAWQDEQTGGRFATMLDRFTGTDRFYATVLNGLHTESIGPAVFPRWVEFLDLYVARRAPSLERARSIAPVLAGGLYGVSEIALPDDRFAGMTFEDALAAFERDLPIEVLFEEGAADGAAPRSPLPRFAASFDSWPIPGTTAAAWYLASDGTLAQTPPADASTVDYLALPDGVPATFWTGGGSSDIWRADVEWNWLQPAPGTEAAFVSPPLAETAVMIGSASADLWISSNLGDTDVEVTLSEVRPDGQEVYVQSGWLRASHRALDDEASTELRPVHTHAEADAAPLPDGELTPVRVEIFPFAHVFRAGSRVRVAVDAPGGNRPVWIFDTISGGEQVTIGLGGEMPSRIVLPVVPGVDVPAGYPPCDALRGQPCRVFGG